MSKLTDAIEDILNSVQEEGVKEASLEEPKVDLTPAGEGLKKLASALRNVSVEPTYSDLHSFLGKFK